MIGTFQFLGAKLALIGLMAFLCGCFNQSGPYMLKIQEYPDRTQDFSMWQLEQFNGESQMGYLIRTDDQRVIVVDGGTPKSSEFVEDYLIQLGGIVHTWVITHSHIDHMGVLEKLMESGKIQINQVIHTAVDLELVEKHESRSYELVRAFYSALGNYGNKVVDAAKGDVFEIGDGVMLKVLGDKNNHILPNYVNNSSLVFKISSSAKSVLFLGDLGIEGGNEILKGSDTSELKSEYVQMAHHGQDGVSREFYEMVAPMYALWPTPTWLWENNLNARGYNTGTWKTLSVRTWMTELQVQRNYVSGLEGTIQID